MSGLAGWLVAWLVYIILGFDMRSLYVLYSIILCAVVGSLIFPIRERLIHTQQEIDDLLMYYCSLVSFYFDRYFLFLFSLSLFLSTLLLLSLSFSSPSRPLSLSLPLLKPHPFSSPQPIYFALVFFIYRVQCYFGLCCVLQLLHVRY